ncbi:hypothetical protein ACS0TY_005959 [Phlomoides rotata]
MSNSMFEESNLNGDAEDQEPNKSQPVQNQDDAKEKNRAQSSTPEELKDSNSDVGAEQSSKTEEDESETKEKALKKPDKILPCPRCNSMDTKFCYFNNYNVNQPRHFCKNCHRYWTAGGTMRNMSVGAGRRKNKYNAASQFHPVLNPNGTVIPFTFDTRPCESMATLSHGSKENADDHSNECSNEEGKTGIPELMLNCHPFPQQVPCFPGAPWPWHSVQWCAPPSLPPTFPPASFPLSFYSTPPPYWGAWNVPWFIPPTPHSSIPLNSGPNSSTLGKHSRDDEGLKPEEQTGKEGNHEKRLWVPKTLRICDPIEAAKSSIWATLGIKNDRADSVGSNGGGLFKALQRQTKGEEKTQVPEACTVLQANPAALSRSLNFRESS